MQLIVHASPTKANSNENIPIGNGMHDIRMKGGIGRKPNAQTTAPTSSPPLLLRLGVPCRTVSYQSGFVGSAIVACGCELIVCDSID